MAATPEAKTKKMIRKVLDEYGAYYAMPMGTGYGNSGVPDFLVCYRGRFIGIEAKAGKGKPTLLQIDNMKRIVAQEGITAVIYENDEGRLRLTLDSIKTIEEVLKS